MSRHSVLLRSAISLLPMIVCAGCGAPAARGEAERSQALTGAVGGLVSMKMTSTVGILLDEIPAGALRDQAAQQALGRGTGFWTDRAQRQAKLTGYRLVFRSGYYSKTKGPLPLPPKNVWNIQLSGAPRRSIVDGHDYVAVDYTFQSYIVTDAASPGVVEPKLANIGGVWNEPFELPADPDLLFERTGYACMDEAEFPPGSVFEENPWYYYDQTCGVESACAPGTPQQTACHITECPTVSCLTALKQSVGRISTQMHFERVAYDPSIAATFRVGTVVNPTGADLAVVEDAISDERDIFYRYFSPNSCEVAEGSQPGWRRLLTFSAVVRNDGTQPIHMGDPFDPNNPWVKAHAFEFSACHQHYHFTHYGSFQFGANPGSKKAFCLEDTNRFHNDESTPLTAIHQTCANQGIGAGWGDEYNFGIPGQWVDITPPIDTSAAQPLQFVSNPDQFLCEGQTLDVNGNPVDPLNLASIAFVPTNFYDAAGEQVYRNRCAFFDNSFGNWNFDNVGSVPFSAPSGTSFVTEACTRGQVGPLRDCGFQTRSLHACTPGQSVQLHCSSAGSRVLRICEQSAQVGAIPCAFREAAANAMVDSNGAVVSFTCPAVRDGAPGAGGYSAHDAPLVPPGGDDGGGLLCTGW